MSEIPNAIKLDAGDIAIERIPKLECDECGDKATCHVVIDFRNVGMKQQIGGNLCRVCADAVVKRLREGLSQ